MYKNHLISVKKENNHMVIILLGIKFKLRKKYTKECIELDKINRIFSKIIPQTELKYLTLGIAEHCNLNCVSCDHFSPLAKETFYELKQFKSDIKRLSELSEGKILKIALEGGEPLLNPKIEEYVKITRMYFPKSTICIITNGLLLNQKNESFFNCIKENNIEIEITKYPVNFNYDEIQKRIQNYGIACKYYNIGKKTSHKLPIDTEGKQNPIINFINCTTGNNCIYLRNGKLYTCTIAPNIIHFNSFFNKNLPIGNDDCIDIYKADSMKEILALLARPIPFCKYCNISKKTTGNQWKVSEKKIEEWT